MTTVTAAHSMSIDGFIASHEDGSAQDLVERHRGILSWLNDGDTPSRFAPMFRMSATSAKFFDEGVGNVGAVISGRRTYDESDAWGGRGPVPGAPLFVMTHRPPAQVPCGSPPYTFVTDGVESAVRQASAAAGGREISVMGASIVQQCLRAGLLDRLIISLVPLVLGRGVRLLEGIEPGSVALDLVRAVDAPRVTHLVYEVKR